MNFTLHQLRIFIEVARQENITKAAENMYMTQPALSIQLKKFQSHFNIALFEKIGKRIYITDFGRSLLEIAKNILAEADNLKYKTREYEGLLTGKLWISSASTGKYVIPYFLSEFINKHNGIDLNLDVSNKTQVINSLRLNKIDFAIVSTIPGNIKVHEEQLLENQLFLVSGTGNDSNKSQLIYREEGSATRTAMEQYFGTPDKRKSIELTSNEAVKQAVIAKLGISILPLIGIKNEILQNQLKIIPSPGLPIVTNWRMIWLKEKKLSPIAEAYLDFIRTEKHGIIEKYFQWFKAFDLDKLDI